MPQDVVNLILRRYPPHLRPVTPIQALGNAGGSSGATLWRYRAETGELALRAWPRQGPTQPGLELIHGWLKELAEPGLVPVPVPVPASDGRTIQQNEGRFWELTPWLPGEPVAERPPPTHCVDAAFAALGSVHRRLSKHAQRGTSPGLRVRVGELEDLASGRLELIASALGQSQTDPNTVSGLRWVLLARAAIPRLLPPLRDTAQLTLALQPCLRDARPEHFLFQADRVSGLIDFGAMAMETVAADLARLIGEWFPGDRTLTRCWLCPRTSRCARLMSPRPL